MTTKSAYSTTIPDSTHRVNIGSVDAKEVRTMVIDVNVEYPVRIDSEMTEIILRVNGRNALRMHPLRALRMGIVLMD
jgi:hypothetical protein